MAPLPTRLTRGCLANSAEPDRIGCDKPPARFMCTNDHESHPSYNVGRHNGRCYQKPDKCHVLASGAGRGGGRAEGNRGGSNKRHGEEGG